MEENRVGIPPKLLNRDKGLRIAFEKWAPGLAVFDKPTGIASKSDPWFDVTNMEKAFNAQIREGKPELEHHGITSFTSLNVLEPDVSGLALCCIDNEQREHWSNAFGSFDFEFHAILVSQRKDLMDPFVCDLPLARHYVNRHMYISHKEGKQSATHFHPLTKGRSATAWLASSRYPRLHQFRLHAQEKGLPLISDPLYGNHSHLKPGEEPKNLDWLHSYGVSNRESTELTKPHIAVAPPKHWKRYLRKIGLEIDEICQEAYKIIENRSLPVG